MSKSRFHVLCGALLAYASFLGLAGCGPEVIPLAKPDPALLQKESDGKAAKLPEKAKNPPKGTSAGISKDPSGMQK